MNTRRIIIVCLAFLVLLWLGGGSLPTKLAIIEDTPRVCYDTFISSQLFLLEKKKTSLKKLKSAPLATQLDLDEELANVLWSDRKFDEAINLYENVKTKREKLSKGYDQKLIGTLISLAGIYRDVNRLDDSIDCYQKVWQLDKAHLPANDLRLARDQTSLAVIDYVAGEIQHDDKQHDKLMNHCIAHINDAQKILQDQKTPQKARLANLLYLKSLAFREMNNKLASKESRQAADYLTKQIKRPYVIPRT